MMRRSAYLSLSFFVLILVAGPRLHAGVDLSPRAVAVAPYDVGHFAVAFAGDRFLTVWRIETGEAASHLVGALSDHNGRRISDVAFPIVKSGYASWIQLVPVDSGFVLFWRDAAYWNFTTYMVEIDRDGNVMASRRLLLPKHRFADVAWNGHVFLFAIEDATAEGRYASAVMLNRAGEVIGAPVAMGTAANTPAVVAAGDTFVAVVPGPDGIVSAHRIAANGTSTVERLEGGSNAAGATIVTHVGGGDVLVVSQLQFSSQPGKTVLQASILTAHGTRGPARTFTLPGSLLMPEAITREGQAYRLWYTSFTTVGPRRSFSAVLDPGSNTVDLPVVEITDVVGNTLHVTTANGIVFVAGTDASAASSAKVVTSAFTPDAELLHSDVVSRLPVRQHDARVSSGPGVVLAVWTESTLSESSTRAALLDAGGAPRLVVTIARDTRLAAENIASNGVEFLVVTSRGDTLLVTRVARDGTVVDASPLVLASAVKPLNQSLPKASAVWAGDRWVVAWIAVDRIYFAAVLPTGAITPARELAFNVPRPLDFTAYPAELRLSFDGQQILLVWREVQAQTPPCRTGSCSTALAVYAARIDGVGAAMDGRALLVAAGAERLAVASSGSEFLVLTHGGDKAVATVVRAAGATLSAGTSRQLFAFPGRVLGDVTWDGVDYVVALRYSAFIRGYGYDQPLPSHLMIRRLNREAVDMTAPQGLSVDLPDSDSAPGVAGGRLGAVIVVHEARPGDSARVVSYDERELQMLPLLPPQPRNVSKLAGSPWVQVSWDVVNGDVDGYLVEIDVPAGVPMRRDLVPAHLGRAWISGYWDGNVFRVRAFNAAGVGPASAPAVYEKSTRRRATR